MIYKLQELPKMTFEINNFSLGTSFESEKDFYLNINKDNIDNIDFVKKTINSFKAIYFLLSIDSKKYIVLLEPKLFYNNFNLKIDYDKTAIYYLQYAKVENVSYSRVPFPSFGHFFKDNFIIEKMNFENNDFRYLQNIKESNFLKVKEKFFLTYGSNPPSVSLQIKTSYPDTIVNPKLYWVNNGNWDNNNLIKYPDSNQKYGLNISNTSRAIIFKNNGNGKIYIGFNLTFHAVDKSYSLVSEKVPANYGSPYTNFDFKDWGNESALFTEKGLTFIGYVNVPNSMYLKNTFADMDHIIIEKYKPDNIRDLSLCLVAIDINELNYFQPLNIIEGIKNDFYNLYDYKNSYKDIYLRDIKIIPSSENSTYFFLYNRLYENVPRKNKEKTKDLKFIINGWKPEGKIFFDNSLKYINMCGKIIEWSSILTFQNSNEFNKQIENININHESTLNSSIMNNILNPIKLTKDFANSQIEKNKNINILKNNIAENMQSLNEKSLEYWNIKEIFVNDLLISPIERKFYTIKDNNLFEPILNNFGHKAPFDFNNWTPNFIYNNSLFYQILNENGKFKITTTENIDHIPNFLQKAYNVLKEGFLYEKI